MQSLCTNESPCLYFFPGMGFRPAVHVVQRDQYGDHMALVVGDDSPLEGKVPPGSMMMDLPVEPYFVLGGPPGLMTGTSPISGLTLASVPGIGFPGYGPPTSGTRVDHPGNPHKPELPSTPGTPATPIPPEKPQIPQTPETPGKPDQPVIPKPPVPGVDIPGTPELPPITPVPLPGSGVLMLSIALGAVLLRASMQTRKALEIGSR